MFSIVLRSFRLCFFVFVFVSLLKLPKGNYIFKTLKKLNHTHKSKKYMRMKMLSFSELSQIFELSLKFRFLFFLQLHCGKGVYQKFFLIFVFVSFKLQLSFHWTTSLGICVLFVDFWYISKAEVFFRLIIFFRAFILNASPHNFSQLAHKFL